MTDPARLSPVQQRALDQLRQAANVGNVLVLHGETGSGKSTVLAELHREFGGAMLSLRNFVELLAQRHPLALEDALYETMLDALTNHECVIVDDLHLAIRVATRCHFNPRSGYLEAPMTVVAGYAASSGKRLIVATDENLPEAIGNRAYHASIADFLPADYRHLCELFLGSAQADQLQFDKIHRFAPKLNAHQLRNACLWHRDRARLETAEFIEYLRDQELASNVALGEVAAVALDDLKGIDDIIQQLEANIALPLENDELANELGLKPKRGVLLVGPPGTGKTTVGRALA